MAEDGRVGREAVRLLVSLNRKDRPAPERCAVSLEKRGAAPGRQPLRRLRGRRALN